MIQCPGFLPHGPSPSGSKEREHFLAASLPFSFPSISAARKTFVLSSRLSRLSCEKKGASKTTTIIAAASETRQPTGPTQPSHSSRPTKLVTPQCHPKNARPPPPRRHRARRPVHRSPQHRGRRRRRMSMAAAAAAATARKPATMAAAVTGRGTLLMGNRRAQYCRVKDVPAAA